MTPFFPCFLAAIVGHQTLLAWGISHTHYTIDIHQVPEVSPLGLLYRDFSRCGFRHRRYVVRWRHPSCEYVF